MKFCSTKWLHGAGLLLVKACLVLSAQAVDTNYNPVLKSPAYAFGTGPIVSIDEAHNNNIADGRWIPFTKLLRADGYRVQSFTQKFTPDALKHLQILVIVNALAMENKTNRSLPTLPAFETAEIDSIEAWIKAGGSLFLLAGHMPWPGAAEALAERFDVFFQNGSGYAQDPRSLELLTTANDVKNLVRCSFAQHPIINGSSPVEKISTIRSGGMVNAFRLRPGGDARAFMLLEGRWVLLFPQKPFDGDATTPRIRADGMPVAATATPGKGRVVLFGINAALFTAERFPGGKAYGINEPEVQNAQLVLNTFHWLSGVLPKD